MQYQHQLHLTAKLWQLGREKAREECKETGEPITWQKWWRRQMKDLAVAQGWLPEDTGYFPEKE